MATMAADPHYLGSVHMSNPAGIRPSCGDCHIPKTNWFVETYVHISAGIHDVIAVMTKNFDDPKVWDARRAEMEKEVRDTMRAENNVTCLSCHSFASIKPSSSAGQSSHAMLKDTKMACADCHTNLVHGPVASNADKK
jgi:nitrate/TMAO reductase-like tetraheme cytochrome c subunit